MAKVTFQPTGRILEVLEGTTILEAERLAGIVQDAPCGGNGKCGKCRVYVQGRETLACCTKIREDIVVTVKQHSEKTSILTEGLERRCRMQPVQEGKLLAAIDIGTTTIVCYLLDGKTGELLATDSMLNPQFPYGADVISRIQNALAGQMEQLTACLRNGITCLLESVCRQIEISCEEISVISVVANPCIQQLFLGILPENLSKPPFSPAITHTEVRNACDLLGICQRAKLLLLPNIAGYIGSDTVGCVLSSGLYEREDITLLIDIGTNGEMVLGNCERMTACSTAAGPALEGARITCGMRGAAGAVDHVWMENDRFAYSVIGNQEAVGICGSGLIDFVAALLQDRRINSRGRILRGYEELNGQRIIRLSDKVYITQEDIREVQMAKGAIAAGIDLMAEHLNIRLEEIREVLLCGAFGSYINPGSACDIGLIPPVLLSRIKAAGNAAGSGSRMAACSQKEFLQSDRLVEHIEALELSVLPEFRRIFARNMSFVTRDNSECKS